MIKGILIVLILIDFIMNTLELIDYFKDKRRCERIEKRLDKLIEAVGMNSDIFDCLEEYEIEELCQL